MADEQKVSQRQAQPGLPNVCLIGTGEYTTGFVGDTATASDKKCGVVGLVFFDLKRRGKVGQRIALCGTNGTKFPAIREHLKTAIADVYADTDVSVDTFPADDVSKDNQAYLKALDQFKPGDVVTVFTPDNTHFAITMAAIQRGLHVMVTKPAVQTLEEHRAIAEAARKKGVLVAVEVHKRYDVMYVDAKNRIQGLGDFGYFSSYMSQPKFQLETFKAWAGRGSDISFYLNSHHVDFHCWALQGKAVPKRVTACAANGVAKDKIGVDAEDTITLMVQWRNLSSSTVGTASYTASWAAAKADVHSQQRFHYMGHKGEVKIDQAHRGYTYSHDDTGFGSVNPLYMRYTPDSSGRFVGQQCYGYMSFEKFIDAVLEIRAGKATAADFDSSLPTAGTTLTCTAILEAGRRSLDSGGMPIRIEYDAQNVPIGLADCFKPT